MPNDVANAPSSGRSPSLTGWERAYAAAIVAGVWIGAIVRAVLIILVALAVVCGVLVLCVIGATRSAQRFEHRTRQPPY